MIRILISYFILLYCSCSALAQQTVIGKVIDENSKAPVPFASVMPKNNPTAGVSADVDGHFMISISSDEMLIIRAVGYEERTINIDPREENLVVSLTPSTVNLNVVTILPGENPAHRIIKKCIASKKTNNPELSTSFRYTAYHKFIFTLPTDSGSEAVLGKSFVDFLDKRHLLLTESVTKRSHIPPNRDKEEVISTRVSGLQSPSFSLLASEVQNFTFYPKKIVLLGKEYVNPVSKDGLRAYLFLIQDTLYRNNDSVFVLSYGPRKGKHFSSLEGELHINTNGYAIENVTASPSEQEETAIQIRQHYAFIDGKQWFPVQLDTRLEVSSSGLPILALGKSYIEAIELNPPLDKKDFNSVVLEYSPDLTNSSEKIDSLRQLPLTEKEENTYAFIDSLGKAENFDQKIKWLTALASSKLPIGFVDLDLNEIYFYNAVEKHRIGLGLHTNDKVSRYFTIGGYAAYGTLDKVTKYGADLQINPFPGTKTMLQLSRSYDVLESGGREYYGTSLLDFENLRQLYVQQMDYIDKWEARIRFRAMRHFEWNLFSNIQKIKSTSFLSFDQSAPIDSVGLPYNFRVFETGIEARLGIGERFAMGPTGLIPLSSKTPIVRFRLTKGWKDIAQGEFDYYRFSAKTNQSFTLGRYGVTYFNLQGGFVEGSVPYSLLHVLPSAGQTFQLEISSGFSTMGFNEFVAERYFAIGGEYRMPRPLFSLPSWRPKLGILGKAAWGEMNLEEGQVPSNFTVPSQGYFEAGLAIHQIYFNGFGGIGLATLYRLGPYSFNSWKNNIGFKITLVAS